mmetsp:Transcript_946/g.1098  ORF Transcript_946/g.1098 Transcript_946/m.1098 type:complete len:113 (-) Transcript_946:235-573(-)
MLNQANHFINDTFLTVFFYLTVKSVLVLYVNQVNQEGHQYYQDEQDQGLVQCSEEENGGGVHGSGVGLRRILYDPSISASVRRPSIQKCCFRGVGDWFVTLKTIWIFVHGAR